MFLKIIFFISFALITQLSAHDNKKKSLKSHEHGVGILNIVQEGNMLQFEYEMPGYDIVGFEYKAEKKEDIGKIKKAIKILSDHKNMIKPSGSAECENIESDAKVIYEGKHSEFISKYKFDCKRIADLKIIYINHFSKFQYSKKLNVKIVANNKKTAYVINKSKKIINVKGFF